MYDYPFSDKEGNFCYRTIGGKKIKVYEHLGLSGSMKKSGKFKKKAKISKKEYGRLAHLIDSNPNKWKKGINSQDIDNKVYFFKYMSYNKFTIVLVEDSQKIKEIEELWK